MMEGHFVKAKEQTIRKMSLQEVLLNLSNEECVLENK